MLFLLEAIESCFKKLLCVVRIDLAQFLDMLASISVGS